MKSTNQKQAIAESGAAPRGLVDVLVSCGVRFATGVPDSLLAPLCDQVDDRRSIQHIIAASEGSALALGGGHYLATGQRPLIYMQNSGLPNAINPYLSMCHPSAYAIPSIWVIGWRGEPGVPDEPQHRAIGAATEGLLALLNVPVFMLRSGDADELDRLEAWMQDREQGTVAVLVSARAVDADRRAPRRLEARPLKRREVLEHLVTGLDEEDTIFAGIGHVGRELLAVRGGAPTEFAGDLLCVGGMGHASQFALGFALARPERRVWCLDGDGAFTMHMGACSWLTRHPEQRFIHVLFDNGVHASVGGQPVCGQAVDFGRIAGALGYQHIERVSTLPAAQAALDQARARRAPTFLWCMVDERSASGLPRPRLELAARRELFWSLHGD
jgi:phosphonopyruvate decarboxylase